jgi:hypothetical protein
MAERRVTRGIHRGMLVKDVQEPPTVGSPERDTKSSAT